MCGLAGFTAPGPEAKAVLAAMNRALAHRGPDGSGVFVDRRVALGHTRLAIIDLAGGAQPRIDEASGDALIFNGEVYGYRALADELRATGIALRDRSDTEVLFQLIRRDGVRRAVARIDGMFAFAFRDGASGALYLVRDRFGEKPLYYGLARDRLVFASEVGALRCHPDFRDATPDRLAAYSFLLFEYLPGNLSGWTGIEKIEPGTILTFSDGQISRERYWRPPFESRPADGRTPQPVDEAEAAERLGTLLLASVQRRVVADVPVGVFLSGGIDSSLITALAKEAAPDLTAFTVRVGGASFDETPHAIAAARHLGVRHEIVDLGPADLVEAFDAIGDKLSEPLGDSSLLPSYLVCRAARRLMTVALGGDGADELFAGYPNFALQRLAPALRLVSHGIGAPTARQSFLWMAPFGPTEMEGLWRRAALPEDALAGAFAPIDRHAAEAAGLSAVDLLLYLSLVTYLPEDILTKTDRASMFNSLEVRAPFLDREVAEYAGALPTRLKLAGRHGKIVLKRLAAQYLPGSIVERKKHGFAVPIGSLIRTLFWERCADLLLSRTNPAAEWFERSAIERLLGEHQAGHDHGKKLWALTMLFRVAEPRLAPPVAEPRAAEAAR